MGTPEIILIGLIGAVLAGFVFGIIAIARAIERRGKRRNDG